MSSGTFLPWRSSPMGHGWLGWQTQRQQWQAALMRHRRGGAEHSVCVRDRDRWERLWSLPGVGCPGGGCPAFFQRRWGRWPLCRLPSRLARARAATWEPFSVQSFSAPTHTCHTGRQLAPVLALNFATRGKQAGRAPMAQLAGPAMAG